MILATHYDKEKKKGRKGFLNQQGDGEKERRKPQKERRKGQKIKKNTRSFHGTTLFVHGGMN